MPTLTSELTARIYATETGTSTALDLGTVTPASAVVSQTRDLNLASGVGVGQADLLWSDERTLAASANENLDLSGALADALSGSAVFARVKGLYIAAAAANTNNVVVGAAASNAWSTLFNSTGTLTLPPGAWVLLGAGAADPIGWAVTAGTGDLLRVANSGAGTPVTYDIVVIGASA
jgi:hypothetical protein